MAGRRKVVRRLLEVAEIGHRRSPGALLGSIARATHAPTPNLAPQAARLVAWQRIPETSQFFKSWRSVRSPGFSRELTSAVVSGGASVARRAVASSVDVFKGPEGIFEVIRHYGKCYLELSKAKLSSFVVLSAGAGYVVGSGDVVDWMGLGWTSMGTMLAAASANSFNQLVEITNDSRMKRTMRRPLPAGRIGVPHALAFAVSAGVTGVTLLACKTNMLTAELGAANILLYTLVYTPLKQIHFINTWVGAVVGAIPPLMGWAAAAGKIDPGGWVLASALYFWQIPHFMSLAFLCRHDYVAGGYKMLSLMDSSGRRTALCALRNCVYMLPLGFIAHYFGVTSGIFGVENLLLTAGIGSTSVLFYLKPNPETARRLFRTSLIYLPFFMSAMIFHRIPHTKISQEVTEFTAKGSRTQLEGVYRDVEEEDKETKATQNRPSTKGLPRPPIAFVSYAPFPFLPAPDY